MSPKERVTVIKVVDFLGDSIPSRQLSKSLEVDTENFSFWF